MLRLNHFRDICILKQLFEPKLKSLFLFDYWTNKLIYRFLKSGKSFYHHTPTLLIKHSTSIELERIFWHFAPRTVNRVSFLEREFTTKVNGITLRGFSNEIVVNFLLFTMKLIYLTLLVLPAALLCFGNSKFFQKPLIILLLVIN